MSPAESSPMMLATSYISARYIYENNEIQEQYRGWWRSGEVYLEDVLGLGFATVTQVGV